MPQSDQKYFVTGIGTDVGKTIISAILTEALQADYWKPVQCGELDNSDSDKIARLISNHITTIHPEAYRFQAPMSPHAAAKLESIHIDIEHIIMPQTHNSLIVEGAGGLMVPLNDEVLVADLISRLNIPVILVAHIYLGSINHTLMSAEILKLRNIRVEGIIFNGPENKESEEYIRKYTGLRIIGRVAQEAEWNAIVVKKYANEFKNYF